MFFSYSIFFFLFEISGGQLKTKNGQKYIVNDTRDGIFVSKSCAILTAIIAVLAIIVAILVTYFLTALNRPDR